MEFTIIFNWSTIKNAKKKKKKLKDFSGVARRNSTVFESNGMIRKPEGSNGASSGNISSIGANTSSEQAPTAFSSIPLHICQRN
jgi:hypothetical protein